MNVYDQAWTNTRFLSKQPECSVAPRALGGWKDASADDSNVKEIASWSAAQLALSNNQSHEVIQIQNVKAQVVNGINYKFDLVLIVDGKVSFFSLTFFFI
jgi:hypothetical protein